MLSIEQKGMLLDAIFAHQCHEDYKITDMLVKLTFEGLILPAFQQTEAHNAEIRRIKSENGKKGGRPRKVCDEKDNAPKQPLKQTPKLETVKPQKPKTWEETFDFSIVDEQYHGILIQWLDYKRSRREKYKNQASFAQLYKRMLKLGTVGNAKEAIETAMANNYAGFFAEKGGKYGSYQQQRELDRTQRRTAAANVIKELFDERGEPCT